MFNKTAFLCISHRGPDFLPNPHSMVLFCSLFFLGKEWFCFVDIGIVHHCLKYIFFTNIAEQTPYPQYINLVPDFVVFTIY